MNTVTANQTYMSDPTHAAGASFARLARISLGAALLLGAVGYLPTVWAAGSSVIPSMLAGIGISLAASLVGAIPVIIASRSNPSQMPIAILGSTAIRFGVVLALIAGLYFSKAFEPRTLFLWTGIAYVALLTVDSWYAIRVSKELSARALSARDQSAATHSGVEEGA